MSNHFSLADVESSLSTRFALQVKRQGANPAVITPGQTLSYQQLDELSAYYANALRHAGVKKGDRVAIIMEQEVHLIAAILAVLRCGGIYVPVDPKWSRRRSHAVFTHARPAAICTDNINVFRARLVSLGMAPIINCEQILNGAVSQENDDAEVATEAHDIAYIYYTSGSTGEPKGVADTHRNVLHNVRRYTNNLDISPQDRLSLLQTCGFSGAVSNIFGALMNGAAVLPVDVNRMSHLGAARWLSDAGVTILHSVPSIFRHIATSGAAFPALRIIRLEGDACHIGDIALFNENFASTCVLVNGLGATETGIVAQHFVQHGDSLVHTDVPIGKATADIDLQIVDSQGQPVPPGVIGEIEVSSRFLAAGYWDNRLLTRQAFVQQPDGKRRYRSGDLGLMRMDGTVEYRGRANFQIKVSGEWLDLSHLESELLTQDSVANAVITAATGKSGTSQPRAYVVPAETPVDPQSFIDACQQHLYAVCARHIEVSALDTLPLDDNGKVDRAALSSPQNTVVYQAPLTPTEKLVTEVYANVLGLTSVGLRTNFFHAGGDSLSAVAASDAIDTRLRTETTLGLLQHAPVAGELAWLIDHGDDFGNLVPLQAAGTQPALFCVHAHMGHVANLRLLARHLAPDLTCFGLQATGLGSNQPTADNVITMAEEYVEAIQRHQPHGPYRLAGYCFGSLVAVEMAHMLQKQGEDIEFLALIDPDIPPGESPYRRMKQQINSTIQLIKQVITQLIPHRSSNFEMNQPNRAEPPLSQRQQEISAAITHAYQSYSAQPRAQETWIFLPKAWSQANQRNCSRWLGEKLHTVVLEAPVADLMREPWARQLADAILEYLPNREAAMSSIDNVPEA